MSMKNDSKLVAKDLVADVRDMVLEWFPSVLRFAAFVVVLHSVVGMAHDQAMEVAALLAFADVATHRSTQRTRVRDDVKALYHKNGSVKETVHHRSRETHKR